MQLNGNSGVIVRDGNVFFFKKNNKRTSVINVTELLEKIAREKNVSLDKLQMLLEAQKDSLEDKYLKKKAHEQLELLQKLLCRYI